MTRCGTRDPAPDPERLAGERIIGVGLLTSTEEAASPF